MKLISCNDSGAGCGVVLDADKLNFPDQTLWWREDGTIDESMAVWTGYGWRAKVQCPVCRSDIVEDFL